MEQDIIYGEGNSSKPVHDGDIINDESNVNGNELQNEPIKEDAGAVGVLAAFFFPMIGVIIYFVQKDKVNNPGYYLWAALVGFIIGFIFNFATANW